MSAFGTKQTFRYLDNLSIPPQLSVIVNMNISKRILMEEHWVDALDASSHEDYQRALTHLDYVDKSFNRKRIRYHLLRGFVCFALKNNAAAVENFEIAIKLLRVIDGFNEDEKNYILGYATIFGNKALEAGNLTKDSKLFPQIDVASIDLSKVRQYFKLNFPLREHPNWDPSI